MSRPDGVHSRLRELRPQIDFCPFSGWQTVVRHVKLKTMKTLQVELPDQMARELENAVKAGQFASTVEAVRTALREFIAHHRADLLEKQQLADIDWALREETLVK